MHKLIATSTILEHELSEFRLLVERQTGIVLDCPNSALAAHVGDYIEAQNLGSSATLFERLRSSSQELSGLPNLYSQIKDELGVMEMLHHPNVVEYYGIEVHRDKVYIFEEYCQGGSLAALLEHRGRTLSRETLLQDVWGYKNAIDTRTVDTHVRRLREKLI